MVNPRLLARLLSRVVSSFVSQEYVKKMVVPFEISSATRSEDKFPFRNGGGGFVDL